MEYGAREGGTLRLGPRLSARPPGRTAEKSLRGRQFQHFLRRSLADADPGLPGLLRGEQKVTARSIARSWYFFFLFNLR